MILTTIAGVYINDEFLAINEKEAWSALVRTDRYTTETHKLIDAQRPEYNVPFAYKFVDNEWVVENQALIDDYLKEQFKNTVPSSISPRQARLILLQYNLLDDVEAKAATDRVMQIWWEYSIEIQRDNEVTISVGTSLGLTEEQLDTMFIEASKL